jgi:hypothetical protein
VQSTVAVASWSLGCVSHLAVVARSLVQHRQVLVEHKQAAVVPHRQVLVEHRLVGSPAMVQLLAAALATTAQHCDGGLRGQGQVGKERGWYI